MGMRYEDFWYNYTLREFWNAVEGFFEGEDQRNKEDWERTRVVAGFIVNQPVYGYKHRPREFNKVLPFPWDTEQVRIDKDTIEELKKHMDEENKKIRDGN